MDLLSTYPKCRFMQVLTRFPSQFRIFIGLMSPGPSPADRRKTAALRNLAAAQAAAGGGDSEDDEEFDMPNLRPPSRPAAATTATNQGDGDGEGGGEGDPATAATRPLPPPGTPMTAEQRDKLREYRREVRETRTDRFLNNPEETISIFFSGYYRDRGMSGCAPSFPISASTLTAVQVREDLPRRPHLDQVLPGLPPPQPRVA